jgi:hypothetical protein
MSKLFVAAAFAVATMFALPAYADCSKDLTAAKEAAGKATDAKKKETAMKHVAMAEGHMKAKADKDCMAEVDKAKAALK